MAPNSSQSGSKKGTARLGKGNPSARRALFQIVFAQIPPQSPSSDFKDYYNKKRLEGIDAIPAIAFTMAKLTEVIYHCLKANEKYVYQGGAK